jgi:prolyl oligopeptidase
VRVPPSWRDSTVDVLHGHAVADPYRWLEDPDSERTRAWVQAQNDASREHLDGLASHAWFTDTMRAIVARPRAGTPERVGGRYAVSRNDGTQQQDVWFVGDTLEELVHGGRLLLDPNTFSVDGTSSLAGYRASRDGRWLAYLVSDGGSDWTTIRLLELASGREVDDVVTKVKFSDVTWLPDDSYLYLHFPTVGSGVGTESAALPGGRLMRHRVGESQDTDELVLDFPDAPRLVIEPWLSHDARWLVVSVYEGTSDHNLLWVYPVTNAAGAAVIGEPRRLVDEAYARFQPIRTDGAQLHLLTDVDAPLRRVVRLDLEATGTPQPVDVLPEGEHLLEHVDAVGEELLAVRLVDATPELTRWTLDGRSTPVGVQGGALTAVHGDVGEDEVFLGLSTVINPGLAHRLELSTGELTELDLAPAGDSSWQPPSTTTERRHATSRDGTPVPYFLIRPSGPEATEATEPRPTLLYGYGGFAIPELAKYRPAFAGWLAAGGTLAIANLRGGSEFGAEWHEAGRLARKQNVFDDFAAVGEHLVASGVTTHGQLAVHGGSNGGLLVGATIAQRPDLAAVALPAVGVLDMLRFHLFTIGAAWTSDYGSPEDPDDFEVLLGYSPLHNLRPGASYPATLVLTGDHDDRVVPAHSFKFTAELQRCQGGDAPVLARIETSTGHGAGKPSSVVAAETADLLAFAAEHTGLRPG